MVRAKQNKGIEDKNKIILPKTLCFNGIKRRVKEGFGKRVVSSILLVKFIFLFI